MDGTESNLAARVDESVISDWMSFEDWQAAGEPADRAVRLRADEEFSEHYASLARSSALLIEFPAFMDGRGFSHGRKLRAHGFSGTLLASGDLLGDQWEFLRRCGFSGIAGETLGGEPGFPGFSVRYQLF